VWLRKSLVSAVWFSLDDREEGAFRELSVSATRCWVCAFEVCSESAGGTSFAIICLKDEAVVQCCWNSSGLTRIT